MKLKIQIVALPALMLPAVMLFTSCSSTPSGQGETVVAVQKGVPGGIVVQTYQETATVTAVDGATRKVTLVTPDGKKETVKAGPEVVNFDQIHVGDQVKATVAEEVVVFMRKAGAPPSAGEASLVALAPVGAKPGALMVNTVEITAKVTKIDLKEHKATVELPDGKSKTFKVRPDVDLTKVNLGEEVVIRTTEAFAITVQKP